MKLLRVKIITARTCGGLLDGFEVQFPSPLCDYAEFDPLCLIGPNGAGKSQFLQVLVEIFQAAMNVCVPAEERHEGNADLLFEMEYLIRPKGAKQPVHVRISRTRERRAPVLTIERKSGTDWDPCDPTDSGTQALLPATVVGYTSGANETLSLPFLVSRGAYAKEVRDSALLIADRDREIPNTRLMLIDYGTHLEVLVANLLFATASQRKYLMEGARLKDLHSYRCIVQLAHLTSLKVNKQLARKTKRKGVQLTPELERYIDQLTRCSTCYHYDEKHEIYIFDFWVNDQTKLAFAEFWKNAIGLYTSLHKLALLNDLAIPKKTRSRFNKDANARRFASRLPEPQDEDKIFRFESVRFSSQAGPEPVDYVSLSDGEHQLVQLLGTLCMVSYPNALFLLDEPESHFNPKWRAKCISRILDQPTVGGNRRPESKGAVAEQDCILTTHAPFVPSDMHRTKVFIFYKDEDKVKYRHPETETYGTTFDTILEDCFEVRPPISDVALDEIKHLKQTDDPEELREGIKGLGQSVEKVLLAEKLRKLPDSTGE
jgi:restriction system-associated AAA family ATPase